MGFAANLARLARYLTASETGDLTATNSPAQFNASKQLATMEAVQRALGSYSGYTSVTANKVLTLADAGKYFGLTAGGWIITLPDPTGAQPGLTYTFGANSAFTLTASAGKAIAGPAGDAASATMYSMCSVVWRGDIWQIVMGGDPASIAASGWLKLPSGLMLQWGGVPSIAAGGSQLVNYPTSFSTTTLALLPGSGALAAGGPPMNGQAVSKTQARFWNSSASAATAVGSYLALGY